MLQEDRGRVTLDIMLLHTSEWSLVEVNPVLVGARDVMVRGQGELSMAASEPDVP